MKKLIAALCVLSTIVGAGSAQAAKTDSGHCSVAIANPDRLTDRPGVFVQASVVCNTDKYNVKSVQYCIYFSGTSQGFTAADYFLGRDPLLGACYSSGVCVKDASFCGTEPTPIGVKDCDTASLQGIRGVLDVTETWKNGSIHHRVVTSDSTPEFNCGWS